MKCKMPKKLAGRDAQLRYLDDLDEKLRRAHNVKGADFRAGRVNKVLWELYLRDWFNPRSIAVRLAIGELQRERAAEIMNQDDAALAAVDLDAAFTPAPVLGRQAR